MQNWKTHPAREWLAGGSPLKGESMSESEVIVREGELLCGVIDKAQVGPTPYSLIHMCYELYGGEVSNTILTALARLFTHYLQYESGFSLGTEDIVVTKKLIKKRRRILRKAKEEGLIATAHALDVDNPDNPEMGELLHKYNEAHFSRDDFILKVLDMEMKKVTHSLNNKINEVCTSNGLMKKFPYNSLQLMVESGAKGSSVNAMQISCLLGQIELEGRRMPLMVNGSTLPSFEPYDTSPQAGGFVAGRFLTGINPKEYFFHCMAGREGLIDTAVKTSRSGYLQRCLIKHLEGLTVVADQTVRDSDGTVIQIVGSFIIFLLSVDKDLVIIFSLNKKWQKKHWDPTIHRSSLVSSVDFKADDLGDRNQKIFSMLNELDEMEKKVFNKTKEKCPDPVNSKYRPDVTFGSVTEKLDRLISDYVSKNPHNLLWNENLSRKKNGNLSVENFKDLCYFHSMKSLAEPGDSVGLLAAQSIGEPSTQMTLNTFHFAGKGEMNVTLGIPRIREILMTASKSIATPTMDLPFLDQPKIKQKAEQLKLILSPVFLKDVIHVIKVKEYLSVVVNQLPTRNYVIRMQFLKHSEYKEHINTSPSKILYYIEKIFIKKLIDALKKKIRKSSSSKLSISVTKDEESVSFKYEPAEVDEDAPPTVSEVKKVDDADSTDESENEGDTTSAESKKRHNQEQEYEDPEEEDLVAESDNESDNDNDEEITVKQEVMSEDEKEPTMRINYVASSHTHWVTGYDFDIAHERWCEICLQLPLNENTIDFKSFIEEELIKAKIHSVPHINEAVLVKNPDDKEGCNLMLKTNGVNFLEIFKYVDLLDINKVYSNNIHTIANIYGIEAAVQAIKRETVKVFAAYGIQVDPRHLSLVADYMTCSGYYRPCNRTGMNGNASPLQQMTFETSKNFMTDSMVMGVKDNLASPSANIVVGQIPKTGTGIFDLLSVST
ncbi:DNA-directed RNA polymerase I subunit RPA1 [Caerostris extrusa]|uniref:DNA-directed RNA polymerase n=1 Tax=Caerostris extrusa TaxID=172846 RepID=A0AAV4X337_CAEEX|nr:DNA-directed RNA polymerase I subunit RPA1 [Caerostris extrusa]